MASHMLFTDHTHEAVYGTRSFANFNEAAYEAAISRMYGGIHYKQACYQGVKMGENCRRECQ